MEFFAKTALQMLGEYLVYQHTNNKVLWFSLFFRTLINLQMIFILSTLVFLIYERWAGITEYTVTQLMVEFFKFHCITAQPWCLLSVRSVSHSRAFTIPASIANASWLQD